MITFYGVITFLFLIGSSALTAISVALQQMGKLQVEDYLKQKHLPLFFRYFLQVFFGKQKWEGVLFSLSFTKHLLRIGFVLTAFFLLIKQKMFYKNLSREMIYDQKAIIFIVCTIILTSLTTDCLFSLFGRFKPKKTLSILAAPCSLILSLCIPLTAPFFRLIQLLSVKFSQDKKSPLGFRLKDKIHELLQETELGAYLDANEQKFIGSIVSFKERIVREVMVPRVNLVSLPSTTSLIEAAKVFLAENFSRIPIYKDTVDNMIGVLLYKDILKVHIEYQNDTKLLSSSIEKIIKPVLYTPETKKIAYLLQEFRSKQIHLAVVVDEWGGTEGIVTIEDILEELVGEIADEYDVGTESLYTALPNAEGWIISAKMSIIDIEAELGMRIPQSPEYDTIGGFVVHRAGAIPSKGWRLHQDNFDLEILSSTERSIEKIKITHCS
ncbi:MAG: hemolysin family protein [Candidatus Rhabdochlamydia sp.]|nr:magnesium and cobalt exporter, family [Chlamydiota bacterium]